MIITYNPPPIPVRDFDYQCVGDNYDGIGDVIGFGKTAIEAIKDFINQMEGK
jgi:hypothetical protein